ncbi:unnamed protein product [Ambrosiozyma monospora]|uniref:Unnamed protein product n=1 Tax=Ambrosiozyma monospora TaxID=43982 RepID=A0ACB5T1L6_AMBMO|nr:unnamed protein product [Ambrosiozyma monospora]
MAYLTLPPEFIPEVSTVVNWVMSFTPLISYGTTVLSIRRNKSTQGFSMDICATMLISATLRIFYYFNDPFEISLLRQCFIMVFIQVILLRGALKYRTMDSDPYNLETYDSGWSEVYERFLEINKAEVLENIEQGMVGYDMDYHVIYAVLMAMLIAVKNNCLLVGVVVYKVFARIFSFFDAHYIRPFNFWQWESSRTYWKFLFWFLVSLTGIQLMFHGYEHFGIILGSASFLIESSLPLPQILMFKRNRTVEGFKTILLLSWLGGDFTKISYLLYGTDNIGWIFIIAALFQMSLNVVITCQFLYFKRLDMLRGNSPTPDILPLRQLNLNGTNNNKTAPSSSNRSSFASPPPRLSSTAGSPIKFQHSQLHNPLNLNLSHPLLRHSTSSLTFASGDTLVSATAAPMTPITKVMSNGTVSTTTTNTTTTNTVVGVAGVGLSGGRRSRSSTVNEYDYADLMSGSGRRGVGGQFLPVTPETDITDL